MPFFQAASPRAALRVYTIHIGFGELAESVEIAASGIMYTSIPN
jgi:hypothetical protein